MDVDSMRLKFNEAIHALLKNKRDDNKAYLNDEEYKDRVLKLKRSKEILNTSGAKKATTNYRMVKKYDILIIDGEEKLVRPNDKSSDILLYVTNEELFDIIHTTHLGIDHGGRNRMTLALKQKYANITAEAIMTYLKLCLHCQKKLKKDSKPQRCNQVDLIDMQTRCYVDYNFIMVHQDTLTKFTIIKPLKTESTKEVAEKLHEIYSMFGPPDVLYSEKGDGFVGFVINELNMLWNGLKIVEGGQRDGIADKNDITAMVDMWMFDNDSKNWPSGLNFVQYQKNTTVHKELGRTPFEVTFAAIEKVNVKTTE